jgi:hypothetical protein
MKKNKLYTVPVPSTEFIHEAKLYEGVGYYSIEYLYEKKDHLFLGGIRFYKVSVIRKRAERCCNVWHVEDTYDTLTEIQNSEWSAEILASTKQHLREDREYHHYMIYLDSVGCFEFIADSWEVFEKEQGDESQ